MEKTSAVKGFYKKSVDERLAYAKQFAELTDKETMAINNMGCMSSEQVDKMVENVIGTFELPLGLAMNFKINNKDYIVPMATEEPSIIAAASNLAKIARIKGGFFATATDPVMISQIQVMDVPDPSGTVMKIYEHKQEIMELAERQSHSLKKRGGGVKDLEVRIIETFSGPMVIIHLLVDTRDAMGANAVNTMAEAVAPLVEKIAGGKVYLRILSNLADKRLVRARAVFDKDALGGEDVVDSMVLAYHFAQADPYRAATHNKGIMNGITSVVRATGNDTRAVEAGAHAYASMSGCYTSMSTFEKTTDGDLSGTIELPMAVGLVGGATAVHPVARACVKILDVKTSSELAMIIGAAGLAQNAAAMKALATEGINRGHMSLHGRNFAVASGAVGDEIDKVVEIMIKEKNVKMHRAKEILEEIRKN